MYDKVRFVVYRTRGKDEFSHLSPLLSNPTRLIDEATGEVGGLNGYVRNFRVREYLWGLSVEGSLTKWLHNGSNLYDLSLPDAGQAMGEISEALHTDLLDASVTRLEFGVNIRVKNTVARYFERLGDMPKRQRDPLSRTSLYYHRRTKKETESLVFYDKLAEARKHLIEIPKDLVEANIMRVELRLSNCLCRQLGQPVYGKTLLDESFFNDLKNRLIDNYYSIMKIDKMEMEDTSIIQKPKDAVNLYFAMQFGKTDNQKSVDDYLQMLTDKGVFKRPADKTRVKKQIYSILGMAASASSDPLRVELDEAFTRLKSSS